MLIFAACSLACLADVLLVPLKLARRTVVKVTKRDFDLDLDVVATGLAGRGAKVAVSAEEATE